MASRSAWLGLGLGLGLGLALGLGSGSGLGLGLGLGLESALLSGTPGSDHDQPSWLG